MIEYNLFKTTTHRSITERTDKVKKAEISKLDFSDFNDYGFDYFDNENFGVGYGGYSYDGRYENSIIEFIKHFSLPEKSKILEVGCAKGYILYEFYKKGFDVYGVDASSYAIKNSPIQIRERLQLNLSSTLSFDDNTFDLVFSKEVLPHLDEKNAIKLARECIRVTKGSNIFFEIQYADDNEGANLMKKWDNTHKTIRPKEWWIKQLEQINYPGSYHFKKLF